MDTSFPFVEESSFAYRQELIRHIRETGTSISPTVEDAFLMIPRHCFLAEGFFEREKEGWRKRSLDAMTEAEWLASVYCDAARITQVQTDGTATSSSSQPSIMAVMLEALNVTSGQNVLEIGTGTGFNSGLLAHIIKDPCLVTTIELDPELALKAQKVLDEVVGPGVLVHVGDGKDGLPGASFDRIIATASCSVVPEAWLENLSPNGRLIGILQPHPRMRGALLQIEYVDGAYQGRLLQRAGFMELRGGENTPLPQTKIANVLTQSEESTISLPSTVSELPMRLQENDFPFFLQYECAPWFSGLRILPWMISAQRTCTVVFHPGTGSTLTFRGDEAHEKTVELRGGSQATMLWEHLQRAYERWCTLGQPPLACYRWTYESKEQHLFCGDPTQMPGWRLVS